MLGIKMDILPDCPIPLLPALILNFDWILPPKCGQIQSKLHVETATINIEFECCVLAVNKNIVDDAKFLFWLEDK